LLNSINYVCDIFFGFITLLSSHGESAWLLEHLHIGARQTLSLTMWSFNEQIVIYLFIGFTWKIRLGCFW